MHEIIQQMNISSGNIDAFMNTFILEKWAHDGFQRCQVQYEAGLGGVLKWSNSKCYLKSGTIKIV